MKKVVIPIEQPLESELIRDCEVLVCHENTVVQFGAVFGKPVMSVTAD
jgi:hypothetical protein